MSLYSFYSVALIVALIIIITMVLLMLQKIKKIHLATYQLLDDTAHTRSETSALFSQIQALFALERKLALTDALPLMRGWAGSPDFLLQVANEVIDNKPRIVMECSSGVSTLVIARCLQLNGMGHVYSLEHESDYAEKTRHLLRKHGLTEWASVLNAPLQTMHTETPWYAETSIPPDLPPIDMLVVDGPPTSVAKLARFPAVPRLMPRMSKRAVVMVDDADRDDEREMVRRWKELYPQLKDTYLPCEKGLLVLHTTTHA